jgi:hypothetical protein
MVPVIVKAVQELAGKLADSNEAANQLEEVKESLQVLLKQNEVCWSTYLSYS